jgi:hypothetical protein
MAGNIYFVTAISKAPEVRTRLFRLISEDDRYELATDRWLVVYDGAARELAEKAGVRSGDEQIGTGLVLPVTTYSGRAPSTLWDWLRRKGA